MLWTIQQVSTASLLQQRLMTNISNDSLALCRLFKAADVAGKMLVATKKVCLHQLRKAITQGC